MASPSSKDLKGVLKRVKSDNLTAGDRKVLSDVLDGTIKLRQLVEKSKITMGGKKVIASLPFGFDIVK